MQDEDVKDRLGPFPFFIVPFFLYVDLRPSIVGPISTVVFLHLNDVCIGRVGIRECFIQLMRDFNAHRGHAVAVVREVHGDAWREQWLHLYPIRDFILRLL